ncbi:MAG TPA: acetyl-coenzyme A synthetase N-terminal domain-containing protein, partial [Mycobacteriales bacterium]|nr:acetyl-coenzyme A synthetase N-terminal domain-containing protein [Mycobacteriales bacterium]
MTREGDLLWAPDEQRRASSRMASFMTWAAGREGRRFDDYDQLLAWSVDDLEGFWSAVADWYGIRWHATAGRALGRTEMPGAEWFPGARLNYAEHVL